MLNAVSIGDVHMNGPLSKLIPDHPHMVRREIGRVGDWMRAKGIQHMFWTGDVGDNPRMGYEEQRALLKLWRDYPDLRFWIILGNHDKFAPDSSAGHSLELLMDCAPENVTIFAEPQDLDIDGHMVRFLPWPFQNFSKKMLNVAHVETAGSVSDSGKPFEGDELYKGSAVATIGHLHTNQRTRNLFYPGTLWQQNFGEKRKKFFHHIEWNGRDDYEITDVRFRPEYTLHTVIIESSADLEKIPTDAKQLVKLVVHDGADVDEASWSRMPNVVKVNAYKTKEELAQVVAADLNSGQSLVFDTSEFFRSWIDAQGMGEEEVNDLLDLRTRVLKNEPLR